MIAASVASLPQEVIDQIVESGFDDLNRLEERSYSAKSSKTTEYLQGLRLVDKRFSSKATRLLFQSMWVSGEGAFDNLLKLSESPYASYLQEIEFNLRGAHSTRDKDLPNCLRKLSGLTSLDFCAPDYYGRDDGTFHLIAYEALRYGNLESLKKLSMTLHDAEDYDCFTSKAIASASSESPMSIEQLLKRVTDLYLRIEDDGSGRDYLDDEGLQLLRDDGMRQYMGSSLFNGVFNLISATRSLESLGLVGRRMTDFDGLDISNLHHLQDLDLVRVYVSFDKLAALLAQNRSTLLSINFWCIELKSGTWKDIYLDYLRAIPNLRRISCSQMGYVQGHKHAISLELRTRSEVYEELFSMNYPDYGATSEIDRHVKAVCEKAGLSPL